MADRLAEIEARLDAATPGPPWRIIDHGTEKWVVTDDGDYVCEVDGSSVTLRPRAALIAAAPSDLRDLLAVAKAARDYVTEHENPAPDYILRNTYRGRLRTTLANLERGA